MNLSEYESLTGITVPAAQQAAVTAALNRVQAILETMLGFTLDPSQRNTNLYNELGKTQLECACPSVDTENLQPADDVVNGYRLFDYNELDKYVWIDPFKKINKVKLVYIKQGTGNQGVTLKTFDNDEVRLHQTQGTLKKYLERCLDCFCTCDCTSCVQLAVDADWEFETLPTDLQYVFADMVTWYSNSRRDIKSETIDTHSYTKFERRVPEEEPHNLSVIKKYAGPHGTAATIPTAGNVGKR